MRASPTPAPADAPTIPVRPLGAFGENVSALGLGLGALARRAASDPWEPTIHAAIGCGMTSIDVAQGEDRAASEEKAGRILAPFRDDIFLSSRCSPLDGQPFDVSAKAVRAQLEDSLRRLQTDRIDLYHAHDIEAAGAKRLLGEVLPALVDARERGDIRYVGASGGFLGLLHEILVTFPIDAVLSYARLDLVNADLLEATLPAAEERGIAVINASPLHMGLLADPRVSQVAADGSPIGSDPTAIAAQRAFQLAKEEGMSLPRLAVAFAAQESRVATTLIGCATPQEVQENARAFLAPCTAAEQAVIADVRALFSDC